MTKSKQNKQLCKNIPVAESRSGGRGSPDMQSHVDNILKRYVLHAGSLEAPIDPILLAKLQKSKVSYRYRTDNWVASLIPMGDGFVITVKENTSSKLQRYAICHEVAHTFFFDTDCIPPERLNDSYPSKKEELLCSWASREMLVPKSVLLDKINKYGRKIVYSFEGISKLAKIFVVDPDIMVLRLTHDLALLEDDWIVLTYSESHKKRYKSYYPRHVSNSITSYMKSLIGNKVYNTISGSSAGMEFTVGTRKQFKFKIIKTEKIYLKHLKTISWISPITKIS